LVFKIQEGEKEKCLVIKTIPIAESILNIHIHHFKTIFMCPRKIAGVPCEPEASGLPYYCTPPVCVPDVIGALAVWRHNIPKKTAYL